MRGVKEKLVEIQDKLRVMAISLTGDINEAEELRQETSLHILNCAESYRCDKNFEGWASTIMKNIFKNSKRGKNPPARVLFDGSDSAECNLYEVNDTESTYVAQEVMEEISHLSPMQSQLLKMRISGYRYEEIAVEMNIPLGYVKSSLHKAKKNLRKRLER